MPEPLVLSEVVLKIRAEQVLIMEACCNLHVVLQAHINSFLKHAAGASLTKYSVHLFLQALQRLA